ncbi:SDR family NAD(P)-dependent oxidoreductase [Micromonospora sp. BRA006-A]|nr:SDR family NAD(P)-dependent oxidoreductase [Micromonospora sp. BRA006-A]
MAEAVDGTVAALGGIDAVVANAGVANRGTIAVGDVEALVRTVEVNLIGVMRTAAATVPALVDRGGYLLIVSSAAAFAALPSMAAYCASKAGVEQFGNAVRLELAHRGVAVGTAHPSWVDTDLVREAPPTCRPSPRRWRSCRGRCAHHDGGRVRRGVRPSDRAPQPPGVRAARRGRRAGDAVGAGQPAGRPVGGPHRPGHRPADRGAVPGAGPGLRRQHAAGRP